MQLLTLGIDSNPEMQVAGRADVNLTAYLKTVFLKPVNVAQPALAEGHTLRKAAGGSQAGPLQIAPPHFRTGQMAWVYMLRGASGRHYIGSTTHLGRRIEEHRRGHTHTTKRLGGEFEIVASLELTTLKEARALEREMKCKKNTRLALGLLRHGGVG